MSAAIADAVLDANYEGPHGTDAEYFAKGVEPVADTGAPVRIMRGGQEAGLDVSGFASRPRLDTAVIRVRVKQLAAVQRGGVFRLKDTGECFELTAEAERFDRARREWTCQATDLKTGA